VPAVRRWSNGLVAAVVVGSMMLLAALVLRFAVLTQDNRRNNDVWLARPERVPLRFVLAMLTVLVSASVTFLLIRRRVAFPGAPGHVERSRVAGLAFLWGAAAVTVAVLLLRGSAFQDEGSLDPVRPTAPADLEGLRYLAGDTDLVAAVQIGEILENPEREKVLNLSLPRLGVFPDLGTVRGVLDRLEQMTKLRREVLDHLVLGAKLSGGKLRVQLILRTRKDYDDRPLHVALNARSHPVIKARERHLYQCHHELLPGGDNWLLVCPNPRTVVLGWNCDPLSEMPAEPRKSLDHLPVSIVGVLKERVRPWGQAWLAGHLGEGPRPLLDLVEAGLGEQDRQLVSKLKTFAVWLNVEDRPALHAALCYGDAAAAAAVETALTSRLAKLDSRGALFRKEEWVTLQYRLGNDTSPPRP
jgi:hypothetical protein